MQKAWNVTWQDWTLAKWVWEGGEYEFNVCFEVLDHKQTNRTDIGKTVLREGADQAIWCNATGKGTILHPFIVGDWANV